MRHVSICRRAPAAIALLMVTAALAGCATPIRDSKTEELDSSSRRMVDDSLASSAARAAKAQETLALVERARTEPAPASLVTDAYPAEMRRPATMNWAGPGAEAVRQVAGLVGYEFRIVGNPPPNPPLVNVAANDLPVAKILEDIGLQVQGIAQVVVDANIKRIEYRYVGMYPARGPVRAERTERRSHMYRSAPVLTK